jgi:predicted hydrolase (HD superfamily)
MNEKVPTREEALALLKTYNKTESLRKHALAVEGVMRYFARKRNEDEEKWGIIGLIHDLDYEQYPDQHCKKTEEILHQNNWPEEYIRAVISHGWGICTDVKPETDLEKVLYAIDELTGLVVTTALVRPSKSVMDVKTKSVKKKGASMLGVEIPELITDTIAGMREVAEEIGLKGNIE